MPCDELFDDNREIFIEMMLSIIRTGDVPDDCKTEENYPIIEHIKVHIMSGWRPVDFRFEQLPSTEALFENLDIFRGVKS